MISSCDDPLPKSLLCVFVLGMTYNMEETERSATMSRIETKKMKEKKNNTYLSALPTSSEEILEGIVVFPPFSLSPSLPPPSLSFLFFVLTPFLLPPPFLPPLPSYLPPASCLPFFFPLGSPFFLLPLASFIPFFLPPLRPSSPLFLPSTYPPHFFPSVGSQESLGRSDKKRKGADKERGSGYIDRSHSESAKDKSSYSEKRSGGSKNHKRQRSWAGNKVLDTEGGEGREEG